MKQRILAGLLAILLLLPLAAGTRSLAARNEPEALPLETVVTGVTGDMFTDDPALAAKLDAIFSGAVSLFTNTSAVYPLGTSLNTGFEYVVANLLRGRQCYIYAQAVYYLLFGDIPYNGEGMDGYFGRSVILSLSDTSAVSCESFLQARVGFGAYIRTTGNADGSYNSGSGHSLIVLSYDPDVITCLEGNADGRGLVCVTRRTWSEFNDAQLAGRGRRICHVIQPTATLGQTGSYVAGCRVSDCYLTAGVTGGTALRSLPCGAEVSDRSALVETLADGAEFTATGLYQNTVGEYWYRGTAASGRSGYLYAGAAAVRAQRFDDVTVSDPQRPSTLTVGDSFTLGGAVSSRWNLITSVTAAVYADGAQTPRLSRTATVNGRSCRLGSAALSLPFETLPAGSYVLAVTAAARHAYAVSGTAAAESTGSVTLIRQPFTVSEPERHYLDLNGLLDGQSAVNLGEYGTCDVYIDGVLVQDDATDYYAAWPPGTRYELRDVRPAKGFLYDGVASGALSGTVGHDDITVVLAFSRKPENDRRLVLSADTLTVETDAAACRVPGSVTVRCPGTYPLQYTVKVTVDDPAVVRADWASPLWTEAGMLLAEGLKPGRTVVRLTLLDRETGETVDTAALTVTVVDPYETVPDGFYRIEHLSGQNSLPLVNDGGNAAQGDTDGAQAVWLLERQADGTCRISSAWDGRILCAETDAAEDGCNVGLTDTDAAAPRRRWLLRRDGEGWNLVTADLSRKRLDVNENSAAPGANVHLWQANGGAAQRFALVPAEDRLLLPADRVAPQAPQLRWEQTDEGLRLLWTEVPVCTGANGRTEHRAYDVSVYDPLAGRERFAARVTGTQAELPWSLLGGAACIAAVRAVNADFDCSRVPDTASAWVTLELPADTRACRHVCTQIVVPPTCEGAGYTLHVCTLCGESRADGHLPPCGHVWDGGAVTAEDPGAGLWEGRFTCLRCGKTETRQYRLPAATASFADVTPEDYCDLPVRWALEQGITTGVEADRFGPEEPCTRAQVVTFLWRAMGKPAPRTRSCPFTDVDPEAYYWLPVLWALEQGITTGTEADRFSPEAPCTRAQVVTFLWRTRGRPDVLHRSSPFADVTPDDYFCSAVLWAVGRGVTNGTELTRFSPDDVCSRAQIVTFLYRELAAVR